MDKKRRVQNAVLLTPRDPEEASGLKGGKIIPFKFNTKGEQGNENGYIYEPGAFDKFIELYYQNNGIAPLFCIQHLEDLDHIAGRVISLETDDKTGEVSGEAWLSPNALHYDKILGLIEDKIFTHVSDCELLDDFKVEDDGHIIRITEASLIHVSLVTMPSDTGAVIGKNKKFDLAKNDIESKREEVDYV